jgi:hypothetical protein
MEWECKTADELVHVVDESGDHLTYEGQPCEAFVYFVVATNEDGERWRTNESWADRTEAIAQAKRSQHWIERYNLSPATSSQWRRWYPEVGSAAYDEWCEGSHEFAYNNDVARRAVFSEFYRMETW